MARSFQTSDDIRLSYKNDDAWIGFFVGPMASPWWMDELPAITGRCAG